MTKKTITLEQGYATEYCPYEDISEIEVNITPELKDRILTARKTLEECSFMFSINIDVPCDFFTDETDKLFDGCPIGVDYVTVYRDSMAYYVQNKHDCACNAEYLLNEDILK